MGIKNLFRTIKRRAETVRVENRWSTLRQMGMHIGNGVTLPPSTWIDTAHCFLIRIEDGCVFGPDCMILAHDASMKATLDLTRVGNVVFRERCFVGARVIVLPGVEIGSRTIVAAGSVVTRSLPARTVCAGSPARPLWSLEEFADRHRDNAATAVSFPYDLFDLRTITEQRKVELREGLGSGVGYIYGRETGRKKEDAADPSGPEKAAGSSDPDR